MRPQQVDEIPETLNWDLFVGPAPMRPYNKLYTAVELARLVGLRYRRPGRHGHATSCTPIFKGLAARIPDSKVRGQFDRAAHGLRAERPDA